MPKITNLKIELQSNTENTYFATWTFNETARKVVYKNTGVGVGSYVKISSGAKYYNGVAVPSWVISDVWKVIQLEGDRAVLGKNLSGSHNIQSAINVKYLTPNGAKATAEEIVPKAKSYLDYYQVKWYYATGDGVSFVGSSSDEKVRQSTYNAPSNATGVKVYVRPIAKKRKVNGKDVAYWTASGVSKYLSLAGNPPAQPSSPPTVEIDKYKLTVSLDNITDSRTDQIHFQLYSGNKLFKTATIKVQACRAIAYFSINPGTDYRVRCRAINLYGKDKINGPWSDFSSPVGTIPATPKSIVSVKATSETSVQVRWEKVSNATSFEVQYTTKKEHFDISNDVQTLTVESPEYAEVTGLETGQEYFFRVRAVNDVGKSSWTEIKSIVIGEKPAAPTTWSSTTTVITGESLILYWVHNSSDNSSQTFAEVEVYYNDRKETYTVENTRPEDEKDNTSEYKIDTTPYIEGTKIQWRVRTAGITKQYGEWSIQRTVNVYAPATLALSLTNNADTDITTVTSFPFYIKGVSGPVTQKPIGYYVEITANELYETVDSIGEEKLVSAGDVVYSQYFDTNEQLLVELLPSSIDLESGIHYTIKCTASMDSGLSTDGTLQFDVAWEELSYEPDAEIGIDEETYSAYISPYCINDLSEPIEDITLSVYRKEFDGSYTELATGLDSLNDTYVNDPHPSLDYARYRIVATSKTTGSISYYDPPGYPILGKSIIIQWDEKWDTFDTTQEEELETPPWTGSMLKLPYNVDIADGNAQDVVLVKYIGREYPVSYYGTHIGSTATWNTVIPKEDKETLYALRRLSVWMGDVYVREPSGSGYWAYVNVSFNQKHDDETIPVTLDITRVEGGI